MSNGEWKAGSQLPLVAGRRAFVILKGPMLAPLVRLVRLIHMTIGISEPKPAEEQAIALTWLALFLALVGIFVIGLFVVG